MIPANAFGSHRMLAEFRETHTVRGYNGAGAGGRGRRAGTRRGYPAGTWSARSSRATAR
jgi:hypothetical protein